MTTAPPRFARGPSSVGRVPTGSGAREGDLTGSDDELASLGATVGPPRPGR